MKFQFQQPEPIIVARAAVTVDKTPDEPSTSKAQSETETPKTPNVPPPKTETPETPDVPPP